MMASVRVVFRFQSTLPVGGATKSRSVIEWIYPISIHAPRGGSDEVDQVCILVFSISIHAPRGGSDARATAWDYYSRYFNPRSPWGERRRMWCGCNGWRTFQSTLPVGGATVLPDDCVVSVCISIHAPRGGSDVAGPEVTPDANNFNPRSPWGERPLTILSGIATIDISIHAPRGGSDVAQWRWDRKSRISIHAPRGGSDPGCGPQNRGQRGRFQSTLPVGGATPFRLGIH